MKIEIKRPEGVHVNTVRYTITKSSMGVYTLSIYEKGLWKDGAKLRDYNQQIFKQTGFKTLNEARHLAQALYKENGWTIPANSVLKRGLGFQDDLRFKLCDSCRKLVFSENI